MEKERTEPPKQQLSFYKNNLPVARGLLAVLWEIGKITTTSFFSASICQKVRLFRLI